MPKHTLYVTGFSRDTKAKDLAPAFDKFGPLVRVDLPAPRHADGATYAFVEFEEKKDADVAVAELHQKPFGEDQKPLTVEWAKSEPRPPRSSYRYRDDYGPPRRGYRDDYGPPPRRGYRDDYRDDYGPPRRGYRDDYRDDYGPPPRRGYRDDYGPPPRRGYRDEYRDMPPRREEERRERDVYRARDASPSREERQASRSRSPVRD